IAQVESAMPLVAAHHQPLTTAKLTAQFGRLGNTPFCFGALMNHVPAGTMLPVSELNRMRRDLVDQLLEQRSQPPRWQLETALAVPTLLPTPSAPAPDTAPQLVALVRNQAQLAAAIAAPLAAIYCEFENPAHYPAAVAWFRQHQRHADQTIWVAPPRITKPLERYILEQVARSQADGYLVRNYDHLQFFAEQRCLGDFSLNVANPLTADYFKPATGWNG
ncbi:MAG TPA: DUF3656 domain-containing protein, partial [Candidatus Obscuribacterales bacterium]